MLNNLTDTEEGDGGAQNQDCLTDGLTWAFNTASLGRGLHQSILQGPSRGLNSTMQGRHPALWSGAVCSTVLSMVLPSPSEPRYAGWGRGVSSGLQAAVRGADL
ncbi:unnamed protein product [Arctogadus glacialis]